MKYTRLTKEQFEELHPEFVNFLATQSIDKGEWDKIKAEKPAVAGASHDGSIAQPAFGRALD